MDAFGYLWLHQHFKLTALEPLQPALLKPVTRVQSTPTFLAVPRHVAPAGDDPLAHVLFALKHEGVNLQILAQVMPRIDPGHLLEQIRQTPGGRYLRIAGYLWEEWTGGRLDNLPALTGARTPLFDPQRYITGPSRRVARWRVDFNGLGSLRYCATVARTQTIEAGLQADLLGQANAFLRTLAPEIRDRTLSWAYLDETRHSFEIERETPDEDRKHAFVRLLQQAHQRRPLSEDYLVELQTAVVSNPFDKAFAFRSQQNWLGQAGRGALAVAYLPPPPALALDLMDQLMGFANGGAQQIDPLIAAALVSFGFVYIHPFMDGNGRLSRFLFHHALCRSGQLADGLVLPVSIAMHKHESEYLRVLRQYSAPIRERWRVTWHDADRYEFQFLGDPSLYRYWDATAAVEFGLHMAQQALDIELKQESAFIARFDRIFKQVNQAVDIRGSDLTTLIISCLDNGNVVSVRRRDQFSARGIADAVFDLIEQAAQSD